MQLIFPSGLAYAVIQMNPLAMVRDLGLDDMETLAAVAEMNPKKYLIYLEYALDLPLPKSRWCRYSMSPIGSTLRPMDRKYRLLPDMVVPIFPNTQYSSEERPPVLPTPSFPLSNCFHWIENITEIRVRRRPNGELFDDARAIELEAEQHVALQYTFSKDYGRVGDVPWDDSDDSASSLSESTSLGTGSQLPIPPDALLDPKVREACSPLSPSPRPLHYTSSDDSQVSTLPRSDDSSRRGAAHHPTTRSGRSDSDSSGSNSGSRTGLNEKQQSVVEEISELNLFGWEPDPTFPLIPLVDLWLELEEHIPADDIPSPIDWYKEEAQIVSIIMDAFARRSRSVSSVAPISDSPSSKDGGPVVSSSQLDRPPNEMPEGAAQRRWRPRALQKIGSGARWVLRRTVRALCLGHRPSTDETRPLAL